jgi:hypothetical protein
MFVVPNPQTCTLQLKQLSAAGSSKQFGHQRGGIPVDLVNPVFWIILCVLGLAYVLALALRN